MIWTIKAQKTDKPLEAVVLDCPNEALEFVSAEPFESSYFEGLPANSIFVYQIEQRLHGFQYVPDSFKILEQETVMPKEKTYEGWAERGEAWFSPEEIEVMDIVQNIVDNGEYENAQVIGFSGLGKTQRAIAWAKWADLAYCKVNCGGIISPKDWFFTREVREGETIDKLTTLSEHLITGNSLILLDELNRTSPTQHGSLFSVLDDTREVHIMHERFHLGKSMIFLATINGGLGYVGTMALDKALTNRFGIKLEAKYPPYWVEMQILLDRFNITEDQAHLIVSKFQFMRGVDRVCNAVDVTTRPALEIAKLMAYGMRPYTAFKVCLLNGTDYNVSKVIADAIEGLQ